VQPQKLPDAKAQRREIRLKGVKEKLKRWGTEKERGYQKEIKSGRER